MHTRVRTHTYLHGSGLGGREHFSGRSPEADLSDSDRSEEEVPLSCGISEELLASPDPAPAPPGSGEKVALTGTYTRGRAAWDAGSRFGVQGLPDGCTGAWAVFSVPASEEGVVSSRVQWSPPPEIARRGRVRPQTAFRKDVSCKTRCISP